MYKIDLLKGQGIPIRTKPANIIVGIITLLVPVIISMAVLGYYLRTNVGINVRQKQLAVCQSNIDKLADVIELHRTFEQEKIDINNGLTEVYSSLDTQFQWSPVLELLARDIPDSIVMTQLAAKRRFITKQVPNKDAPEEMIDVQDVQRTLQISVSAAPEQNCDKAVRDFTDKIRFSEKIGPKIKTISISQEFENINNENLVSYQIDCVFKSQL